MLISEMRQIAKVILVIEYEHQSNSEVSTSIEYCRVENVMKYSELVKITEIRESDSNLRNKKLEMKNQDTQIHQVDSA